MTEILPSYMTDSPNRQPQYVVGVIVGGHGDATSSDDASDDCVMESGDRASDLDE